MNVNEHYQLDQRVRESPDLLAGIVGSAMDAIIAINDAQRIVLFNAAAQKMFGCPADEAIGNSIERFIPQRFRAEHSTHVRHFGESGVTNRTFDGLGTLWGLRATGEEFPIEASISKVESGGKKFFTAVIRDITERKIVDESRSRLAAIVESCEDAIISKKLDGLIESWNAGAERIFGYTEAEAVGQPITIIIPPELRDEEDSILEWLRAGERIEQYETVRVTKAGKKVDVSLTVSPVKDSTGRVVGASKIVRDITKRKQSEKALRESEERFRSLYENSTLGLYRTTPDGKILLANPSLVKMLGFSSFSELAQRNLEEKGFEPGYERAEFQHWLATEGEVKGLEASWTRRNGTAIFVRESAKAVRDAEGKIAYYEGTVEDITERKRAEEALRQSEEKFLKLFRGSPVAVALSSVEDGRLIEVNNTFEHFFGYRHEEVIGSKVSDIGIWADPSQREELIKRLLSERSVRDLELLFRTKNGGIRSCLVSAELIEVGNKPCILSVTSDITERKRTAEALRKSEERFRLAALAGKMFAYEWDAATDVILRSSDFAKVLGGDEPVETTGNKILAKIHPDDRERVVGAVAALSRENPNLQISYRMLRNDRTVIWVERNSRADFDDQGRMQRIVGMVKDVTERKQAEKALRESEEQFRTLAEAIPQLCWMARGDGYIFWYNQRWYTYTGTTPAQMEGWGWQAVHDPRTLPIVVERWNSSISTGEPFDMVFPLRGADGVFRPFLTRVMPIKDAEGRVARWFGTNTDITELRDAQEALRVSEERLRMGQWAAHIGTFDLNIRTGVDVWTPETEVLYGLPSGGFGGTWTDFENLIHPDDRERVIKLNHEMMRTGQPTEGEWRVVWPDGSVHWIAGRAQVFMDESGEPSRMLGVNLDITERKRAEEVISGMTRKLIEAQEQERARIARELHDDITQRLAMLAIEIEQVQECSEMPSEVRDRAHELSNRAKEISTDIQTLSHELHSSRLDYLGIVGGMKSWCNEFGERQGIEIEFNPDVRSSVSPEISLCLFRVLQEALHNAAKYSGVKRIDVQLHEESGEIQLIVSDLGKGFDLAAVMQDRGLGITSMQERVRLARGTLVIDSKPLAGTTIHVRVPLGVERSFQRAAG